MPNLIKADNKLSHGWQPSQLPEQWFFRALRTSTGNKRLEDKIPGTPRPSVSDPDSISLLNPYLHLIILGRSGSEFRIPNV
jgi:hypothetical protein